MKINLKELEILDHQFVEQLQELLNNSFSNLPTKFKVQLFTATDPYDIRSIYFTIDTNLTGNIYIKRVDMKPFEIPADVENDFINEVINDLILGGCTFLYTEKGKMLQRSVDQKPKTKNFIFSLN
jgi:hypothetical protein